MKKFKRLIKRLVKFSLFCFIAGVIAVGGVYLYLAPNLPSAQTLKDVRYQVPLRVYTADEKLIAEFGEMKRTPVEFQAIPTVMINALISAEDDRFFDHPGVDYKGLIRAAWNLLLTGERSQGGSTITMQVARNFFLSPEKTYIRKINEIFLSFKIEHELSKEEILALYLNKIYFGNRAYGVVTAAQVYYGKTLEELTLAETAMIMGLPKAPSAFNPLANPERAIIRRNYVLGRMYELGYINKDEYDNAINTGVTATLHGPVIEAQAPYVAEMVRKALIDQFGEKAYSAGLSVYTTINSEAQMAANNAVQQGLIDYDHRHGYKGPLEQISLEEFSSPDDWSKKLSTYPKVSQLQPGLVVSINEESAYVYKAEGISVEIALADIKWAREYINENRRGPKIKLPSDVLSIGDIVMISEKTPAHWQLAQIPQASASLISLNPNDGSIMALVGGFDFFHSKFNRVTQAKRQPGSSFKPFIYSAALEKGFTAASMINDAPIVFEDPGLEAKWRPENYSGKFFGPTRLRFALTKSRNLVSIRLLNTIGIKHALNHIGQFGFDAKSLPRNLSLSLGSADLTSFELSRAHAVFANGGYLIEPYFIDHIKDVDGNIIEKAKPYIVCDEECEKSLNEENESDPPEEIKKAPRIISAQNAYIINSIMQDVVQHGTARRAKALKRTDLAGKTGTTNDQRDAWFVGFNKDLLTISWVGFDDSKPLGARETGGRAALPIWIDYMKTALKDKPNSTLEQPDGMITLRIDPKTGLRAASSVPGAIFEIFRNDHAPTEWVTTPKTTTNDPFAEDSTPPASTTEQLF